MALLDTIYDAISDEAAFSRLPEEFSRHVGSRSCVIQVFSKKGELTKGVFNYFTPESFAYYERNELYKIDIWTDYLKQRQKFGHMLPEFLPPEEFHRSAFYNELFRRIGDDTARAIGGMFPTDHGMSVIGLHRAGRDKPFDDEHLARAEEMTPHLCRAFKVRSTIAQAEARTKNIAAGLDTLRLGVLRVDASGGLSYANHYGMALLARGDGIAIRHKTICVESAALRGRFAEALRSAAMRDAHRGDAMLVPRPSGKPAYRVIIVPDQGEASGRASVLIDDPSDHDPGFERRIMSFYGLTSAEAAVAKLMMEGLSPAETAEQRGVSIETVRTQIKKLLEKTETDRLGELLATLGRTARTN